MTENLSSDSTIHQCQGWVPNVALQRPRNIVMKVVIVGVVTALLGIMGVLVATTWHSSPSDSKLDSVSSPSPEVTMLAADSLSEAVTTAIQHIQASDLAQEQKDVQIKAIKDATNPKTPMGVINGNAYTIISQGNVLADPSKTAAEKGSVCTSVYAVECID